MLLTTILSLILLLTMQKLLPKSVTMTLILFLQLTMPLIYFLILTLTMNIKFYGDVVSYSTP